MSTPVRSGRVTVEDGRALLAPPVLLDVYNAPVTRQYIADAFEASACGDVVFLMGAVEVCDEDGLGCLIDALLRANALNATVYLLRAPQHMIDRLTRTGLLEHFRLIESLGELTRV